MKFRICLMLPVLALIVSCNNNITSPNGNLRIKGEGQEFGLFYAEKQIFDAIHVGLVTEKADYDSNLSLKKVSGVKSFHEEYNMVAGKRSHCVNDAKGRIYTYANAEGAELQVEIRLYNDGLALRYILPEGEAVTEEKTSYHIADGVNRWFSALKTDYEQNFPLATDGKPSAERAWPRPDPGKWAYPALLEPQESVFALICEANLRHGDSASSLDNSADTERYTVHLSGASAFNGGISPWRTVIVGELSDIVESTLVTDLSEPSAVEDVTWIKPGVSSWIYWAYNHGSKNFDLITDYIDLAAEMHWPYCLVDWEWPQMEGGKSIEDVMAYANAKGVKINLWYNSGTSWIGPGAPQPQDRLLTAQQRESEMSWLESMGVTGIKVDFFSLDAPDIIDYYLDILEDAARHHLAVDFHGCTVPRGWQRTWPNMMSMESVYGAEWYNNGPAMTQRAASHNATLPFTRNVIGPMDYTPGTFTDSQFPHITTNAHELALVVLFESGLQHMPDRPSAYRELPAEIKTFFGGLPANWDDTKLLSGYPGKEVVLARRSGSKWYIAGINGQDSPCNLSFSLEKLNLGNYSSVLFCDGNEDREIAVSELKTQGAAVSIPCRARGGFVAVIE